MKGTHRILEPMRHAAACVLVAGCLLAWCVVQTQGQEGGEVSKTGTTMAQFLKIEVSPRAAAMGAAFVAVTNDASALYWNPAGLSRLLHNEFTVAHTSWLADMSFDFSGVVISLDEFGTLGASATMLSMGDMDVRTVDQPEGTGERFGAGDLAIGLSYARNLTDKFSVGFTGKYVREFIWHMSASAFGIDVGTLYKTDLSGLTIGMSISNFGGKMKYDGNDALIYYNVNPGKFGSNDKVVTDIRMTEWALPLIFRVGLSMEPLVTEQHRVVIAVDALHPNDNTESMNVGFEYTFNNLLSLRGGYKSLFRKDSEEGLTLGGGIAYPIDGVRLRADYAWADFGRLTSVHRFAFSMEF